MVKTIALVRRDEERPRFAAGLAEPAPLDDVGWKQESEWFPSRQRPPQALLLVVLGEGRVRHHNIVRRVGRLLVLLLRSRPCRSSFACTQAPLDVSWPRRRSSMGRTTASRRAASHTTRQEPARRRRRPGAAFRNNNKNLWPMVALRQGCLPACCVVVGGRKRPFLAAVIAF